MSSSIFTFYKIVSKDDNIKEIYIGKTTNFKNRVKNHRYYCYNENRKEYNYKLYQFIRENGGINNFNFIQIETNEYNDKNSSLKERYYIEELNATLNSYVPSRTQKEWYEDNIKIINEYQKEFRENNREKKNKNQKKYFDKNREIINEKQREKITCECGCEIRKDYLSKHLKTKKHQDYLFIIK
jgi:hypothetical protein